MKSASALGISLLMFLTAFDSMAVEPVVEPHAMVYYQFSFDNGKSRANQPVFGFRVDRASFTPGEMIEYQQLLKRPAMFDFRLGNKGVEGVYISGIDYLQQYRVYRAGEESETEMEQTGEEQVDEPDKPRQAPKILRDIGNTIDAGMEAAPTGVLIGLALGAGLLLGVGN